MTRLPPEIRQRVEAIKAKVKLRDVLPNLKAQGTVECPLCKRPQKFTTYKDCYGKCWSAHCKWNKGVDVIELFKFKHNLDGKGSFFEALERLELQFDIEEKEAVRRSTTLETALEVYKEELKLLPEDHAVKAYIRSRGWSIDILYSIGIGYAAHTRVLQDYGLNVRELIKAELMNRSLCEHFGNRLIFPLRDISGKLVKLTGRTLGLSKDKWKHTTGPMTYLIGEDRIPQYSEERVYLCEGYPDTLTLWQLGLQTLGTCGLSGLVNQVSKLKDFKEVIAIYDIDVHQEGTDKAGEYKSWGTVIPQLIDLQQLLPQTTVYIWFLPGEGKDREGTLYSAKDINEYVLGSGINVREFEERVYSERRDIVSYAIGKWGSDLGYHLKLLRLCQSTKRGMDLMEAYIPARMSKMEYAMSVLES